MPELQISFVHCIVSVFVHIVRTRIYVNRDVIRHQSSLLQSTCAILTILFGLSLALSPCSYRPPGIGELATSRRYQLLSGSPSQTCRSSSTRLSGPTIMRTRIPSGAISVSDEGLNSGIMKLTSQRVDSSVPSPTRCPPVPSRRCASLSRSLLLDIRRSQHLPESVESGKRSYCVSFSL
jgi:hypothetical protein